MAKASRVLALLEALQDRPFARGPELAARLGVDERTLRRDVTALRDLGLPVEAERGRGGGYRLRPGYRMPPLMFTPAEATAVALGLLAAQRDGVDAAAPWPSSAACCPTASGCAWRRSRRRCASRARPTRPRRRARSCSRSPRPPAAAAGSSPTTPPRPARRRGGSSARSGWWPTAPRWYVPAFDHGRGELRAFRADRFGAVRTQGAGRAPATRLRRRRVRQPHARPRPPRARGRGHPPYARAAVLARAGRARAPSRRHADAAARRLARLGGRAAGLRRLPVHRRRAGRAARRGAPARRAALAT